MLMLTVYAEKRANSALLQCADAEVQVFSANALALLCETENIAVHMVAHGLLEALSSLAASDDSQAQVPHTTHSHKACLLSSKLQCWICIKLAISVKVEVAKSFAAISRFPANTAAIATSGCLQPLLNLMVEATDPTVKIACAQALGNLAEHREARALITSQPSTYTSSNPGLTQDRHKMRPLHQVM